MWAAQEDMLHESFIKHLYATIQPFYFRVVPTIQEEAGVSGLSGEMLH